MRKNKGIKTVDFCSRAVKPIMEGISSSDRARKLFERVVDIVTNDFVQERYTTTYIPAI